MGHDQTKHVLERYLACDLLLISRHATTRRVKCMLDVNVTHTSRQPVSTQRHTPASPPAAHPCVSNTQADSTPPRQHEVDSPMLPLPPHALISPRCTTLHGPPSNARIPTHLRPARQPHSTTRTHLASNINGRASVHEHAPTSMSAAYALRCQQPPPRTHGERSQP